MALSQQSTYVPNTGFGRERLRCRGAMAEVDPDRILGILTAHRAILASGGDRLVQARHWRPVTRVESGGAEYAVKQYARGSAGSRLRRLVAGSRAGDAIRRFGILEALGIAAAPPIAIVESPAAQEPESYLITRWIHGPSPSQQMRAFHEGRDEEARSAFLERGGRWLARLHDSGVWMNDCWDGNFVVAESGGLVIVDYDSAHFARLNGEWQLRNLRQFYRAFREGDSAADRSRFARA